MLKRLSATPTRLLSGILQPRPTIRTLTLATLRLCKVFRTGLISRVLTSELQSCEARLLISQRGALISCLLRTQLHSYTVKYGANEISYSVDGQVFVNYTKGSNDAYWPGNGPMSLNIAMWQDTARKGWMGEFVYVSRLLQKMHKRQRIAETNVSSSEQDPNNPPVYYIQSVSIKGCVTNLDSANATAPSSVVDGSSAIPINQPTSISGLSSLVTASQTARGFFDCPIV